MEPVPTQSVHEFRIARFCPRIAALCIDCVALGVPGFALGSILGESLAPAGTPARPPAEWRAALTR